jgi:hypothetical protein
LLEISREHKQIHLWKTISSLPESIACFRIQGDIKQASSPALPPASWRNSHDKTRSGQNGPVREGAPLCSLVIPVHPVYYRKIEELTRVALAKCAGKFMVGYTDLHGSLDCVVDWRNPETLCMDLIGKDDMSSSMNAAIN